MLQSLAGQRKAPVLFRVGEFRAFAVLVPVLKEQEGEGNHRERQEGCTRGWGTVRKSENKTTGFLVCASPVNMSAY
jgi:hypothetical protein